MIMALRFLSASVADLQRKPAGVALPRRSSAGLAVLMAVRLAPSRSDGQTDTPAWWEMGRTAKEVSA
jgi:hypothetical protein